jgi:hypothetical protein
MINRLLPALAFVSLPAVCLAGWFLRNTAVVGSLLGLRHPPRITWAVSVSEALATLLAWALVVGLAIGIAWIFNRVKHRGCQVINL